MKLPADSVIAPEKLSRYLLVRLTRGDKSGFLALAGFGQGNSAELEKALREQVLTQEAVPVERNKFGEVFEIRGRITGPNGRVLSVRTIWMTEHLSGQTKFITLIPERQIAQ